jgi:acetyl-CoA acetyltransferase family protein
MTGLAGRPAYVVDVVRTPFGRGRPDGALATSHPVDLLATTLQNLASRTGLDPAVVEDHIAGCVQQVGEQAGNIARHAVLAAGWPVTVPGVTLDRKCGSFQQSVHFAAQAVASGAMDVVVAGGVEMMSRIPMRTNRLDRDELGPMFHDALPDGLVRQGISAELIAAKWKLTRERQDAYAARSHARAASARDAGWLDSQIAPLTLEGTIISTDEGIRDTTTPEILAGLKASFARDDLAERFPQISWSVTAGNSSQITDGAAASLIVSEEALTRWNLTPLARVVGMSVVGDDPIYMLTGVIPATHKVLAQTGLSIDQMDTVEVNEAFASVALAWIDEFNANEDVVNPWGGAIAFGHPVGASGARLMANLIHRLQQIEGRYGLWTMCESGGMANATILERV